MKVKSVWFEKMNEQEIVDLQRTKLPIKISYFLKRVLTKLREESKIFFEQKQAIQDKYKDGEKNGQINIPPENTVMFLNELGQLYEEEVDIPIDKYDINLEEFPEISVVQLEFIEPFFNITNEDV